MRFSHMTTAVMLALASAALTGCVEDTSDVHTHYVSHHRSYVHVPPYASHRDLARSGGFIGGSAPVVSDTRVVPVRRHGVPADGGFRGGSAPAISANRVVPVPRPDAPADEGFRGGSAPVISANRVVPAEAADEEQPLRQRVDTSGGFTGGSANNSADQS